MISKQQRQQLKSIAHNLKPIFQVGKSGLSDDLIIGVANALEKRELIKISVLQNCPYDKKEVAYDLANLTNSEVVQIIGRTIVLYRRSNTNVIIDI